MIGWQWHQLNHMQIICTSLQTDNHASSSSLHIFYRQDALPATCQSTEGQNTQNAFVVNHAAGQLLSNRTFCPTHSTSLLRLDRYPNPNLLMICIVGLHARCRSCHSDCQSHKQRSFKPIASNAMINYNFIKFEITEVQTCVAAQESSSSLASSDRQMLST